MRERTTTRGYYNLFVLPLIEHIPLGSEDELGKTDYLITISLMAASLHSNKRI